MSEEKTPRRVVIATDFSSQSLDAAKWATGWVSPGAEIVLVHALVVPEVNGFLADRYPLPETLLRNARLGAEKRLKELTPSLQADRVWLEVREGRPADVIAQVAHDYDAELIVVGKHGTGGRLRGYTGRTADHLVRNASVPVLVASGIQSYRPRQLLAPLTFSSVTPFIVDWCARIATSCDANVLALHVIGSAVLSHVLTMSAVTQGKPPMDTNQIDSLFADERNEWRKRLLDAGVPEARVKSQVVFGEVSEAILGAVAQHGADLIVMGSHAGPVRRLLLGSAASAVLRNADVPVLVVVEPDADSLGLPNREEKELEAAL